MILTRNFMAEIILFYNDKDVYETGRNEAAEKYLCRHGWKEYGGCCGSLTYKGLEFKGTLSYRKSFSDINVMQEELDDIESAFHDRKTPIHSNDVYSRVWGAAKGYERD